MLSVQSLDLTDLDAGTKTFDLSWPAEVLGRLEGSETGEGIQVIGPLVGSLRVSPWKKEGLRRYKVSGQVQTRLAFYCSRCLESAVEDAVVDFDLTLVPELAGGAAERELTAEELDQELITDGRLDLVEMVREQILLSRPMIDLCRPDCQGLCPGCGADLNKGSCNCPEKEIDPRLADLAKFKVD